MQLITCTFHKLGIGLLLFATICTSTGSFQCDNKDGLCGCIFKKDNKSMLISLAKLDRTDGQAYFQKKPGDIGTFNYYLNLCTGFDYPNTKFQSSSKCTDVTGCQVSNDGSALSIAKPAIESFGPYSAGTRQTVRYVKTAEGRQMILFLTCDHNVEGKVDPIQFNGHSYYVGITSKHVCPQQYPISGKSSGGGLSIGSVLVIIFVVVLVIYLVSGILFRKYKIGATGKEVIPNVGFWSSLPGLIKDGCVFSGKNTTQLCQKSDYEKI